MGGHHCKTSLLCYPFQLGLWKHTLQILPPTDLDRNCGKRMRVTAPCGCKCSVNKRKKTFTLEKLCKKHMTELMKRIHDALWYGIGVPKQDATPIFGKSILKPDEKLRRFWLGWLDNTRRKAVGLNHLDSTFCPACTCHSGGTLVSDCTKTGCRCFCCGYVDDQT